MYIFKVLGSLNRENWIEIDEPEKAIGPSGVVLPCSRVLLHYI
ncbi:MAG TPA: hypothetical protein VEW92_05500 [Nitrososphaeraceae archaeon]|nr:hypothetical protein [Nitrososphaeraceae archaeon]